MEFIAVAKLSQQNQLTLPKEVRELMDVKGGDKVFFSMKGEEIRISNTWTEENPVKVVKEDN